MKNGFNTNPLDDLLIILASIKHAAGNKNENATLADLIGELHERGCVALGLQNGERVSLQTFSVMSCEIVLEALADADALELATHCR